MKIIYRIRSYFGLLTFASLAACGGGGGSGSVEPPPSTASFPLAQAIENAIENIQGGNFSISGESDGFNATGNGTVSFASPISDTFEGQTVISQAETLTGSVTANNTTVPISNTQKEFYTSDFDEVGYSDSDTYCVAETPESFPATVKIGNTGNLSTFDCYQDETKSTLIGKNIDSYVIETDVFSTTAIVNTVTNYYDTTNTLSETDQERWRITETGTYTFVSLTATDYTVSPAETLVFTATN